MKKELKKMERSKIYENASKAKKIKILLKNYDTRFKSHQEMANFQEPVLLLMRNTRKVEFFDNATTGYFQYNHTDGSTRKLKLSPEFLQTFDYGKRVFKGYIAHEDYPTPLAEKPIITAEQFQWAIDKTQQDMMNYKAKELVARGDMWWKIFLGIGIVILALAVGNMLAPDFIGNLIHREGKAVTETVVQNATVVKDISLQP